jgi:REP element-mobilizing transposase RayT
MSLKFTAPLRSRLCQEKNGMEYPIAYLITFTTYGTWLHGDNRHSVSRRHNQFGSNFVAPASGLNRKEQSALNNPPVMLGQSQRDIVLQTIFEVCEFRGWFAHAVHVRSNHVHVVVSGNEKPEKMMVNFKAYATRAIRGNNDAETTIKKYWTRHGSTKYICSKEGLASAIRYVEIEQGKMMSFGQSHERK